MTLRTRLLVGHVLDQLRTLPDKSVHCCVTSPPYFGLRSYGTESQIWGGNDPACVEHRFGDEGKSSQRHRNDVGNIGGAPPIMLHPSTGAFCRYCDAWRGSLGLEPTPSLYIEHLVTVFREVRRVLRDDGTFWLNIGDSYASGGRATYRASDNKGHIVQNDLPRPVDAPGIKPKDLIGIPWMAAFALRDDGWYLRSEIIWAKSAPMPESVTDRPTNAQEKIFLFSKNERYFYDQEAVKETALSPAMVRDRNSEQYGSPLGNLGQRFSAGAREYRADGKRNQRNVWTLPPTPFSGSHFATFPKELPRRAILAGTSVKGVCAKCATPWVRIIDKKVIGRTRLTGHGIDDFAGTADRAGEQLTTTLGWQPSCKCADAGDPIPATVIDPFFGSGTTGVVAQELWCSCIGIDLSEKYAEICKERMPDGLLYSLEVPDAL